MSFPCGFRHAVPKASLGMLQDIHWSECLIGYFNLCHGNIYAACLREAMLKDAPNAIDELPMAAQIPRALGCATTFATRASI